MTRTYAVHVGIHSESHDDVYITQVVIRGNLLGRRMLRNKLHKQKQRVWEIKEGARELHWNNENIGYYHVDMFCVHTCKSFCSSCT